VLEVLRGDLEAVEEQASAAGIKPSGAKRFEHLGDSDLDGTVVFHEWEDERLIGMACLRGRETLKTCMEVAIVRTAECGRVAPGAAGHDAATF
jgi:hypothetical protein